MDFARELLCEVVQEVQPLLDLHYRELCLHQDVIKLDPMWPEYALLEQLERFVVFTARDEGRLVGYSAFFLNRHMHYGGFTVAQNDVLFLHPAARRGTTGLRLIDWTEQMLWDLAADKITYHIKFALDWRPILHRRGYADEEVMVAKMRPPALALAA
jgi:GNAT superfamily N-acetyltransferase